MPSRVSRYRPLTPLCCQPLGPTLQTPLLSSLPTHPSLIVPSLHLRVYVGVLAPCFVRSPSFSFDLTNGPTLIFPGPCQPWFYELQRALFPLWFSFPLSSFWISLFASSRPDSLALAAVFISARSQFAGHSSSHRHDAFLSRVRCRSLITRCGVHIYPPPFPIYGCCLLTSFDCRVICIYDYLG